MASRSIASVVCVIALVLAGSAAGAQSNRVDDAARSAAVLFLGGQRLRGNVRISDLLDNARNVFANADVDGEGIGQSDIDLPVLKKMATERSRLIERWLVHDLNGDGIIETEEASRSVLPAARKPLNSAAGQIPATQDQIDDVHAMLLESAMPDDPDGNGIISHKELFSAAASAVDSKYKKNRSSKKRPPMFHPGFDQDGDLSISIKEVNDALFVVINDIDTDLDGIQSDDEVRQINKMVRDIRNKEKAELEKEKNLRN